MVAGQPYISASAKHGGVLASPSKRPQPGIVTHVIGIGAGIVCEEAEARVWSVAHRADAETEDGAVASSGTARTAEVAR